MNRKFLNKIDLIIIGIIILIGLVTLAFQKSTKSAELAEIYINSTLVKTVSLKQNGTFTVPEAESFVVEVNDGKIAVCSSPCKNKVCVHQGYISKTGQSIVCLPYALSVRTVGSEGYDAVIG